MQEAVIDTNKEAALDLLKKNIDADAKEMAPTPEEIAAADKKLTESVVARQALGQTVGVVVDGPNGKFELPAEWNMRIAAFVKTNPRSPLPVSFVKGEPVWLTRKMRRTMAAKSR